MKIEDSIKQQTPFSNEREKLMVNLMYTASWLNLAQSKFFKEYELTVQQYNILRILRGQKGKPLGIQSITERMIDRMSNSSRLVEKLRAKGLVDRVEYPGDRRQVNVSITKRGLNLLDTIHNGIHEIQAVFSSLNEDESKQLNQLLDKLRTQE